MRYQNGLWIAVSVVLSAFLGLGLNASAEEAAAPIDQWERVGDVDLSTQRGGAVEVSLESNAELMAEVKRNSVGDGTTTGNINVSDMALSDLSGVQAFTLNSGNNSLIQTNMIVNVYLK